MELFGKMCKLHAALLFLSLILSSLFSLSVGGDILTPTQPLRDGQILISSGERFALGFFSPVSTNNRYVGIWYKVLPRTILWVANRQHPISERNGSLSITANGTLIITDQNSKTIWSSGLASPVAQLLDDGNFIVKEAKGDSNIVPGSLAWQSFDYPTDTLLAGMKFGWNLTSGLNRNFTSWASPSDPALGSYTVVVDLRGVPQIILLEDSKQLTRAGPWNGQFFSGDPDIRAMDGNVFTADFVIKNDEVFYMYNTSTSIITRLTVDYTGHIQRLIWLNDSQMWSVYMSRPKDLCDYMSQCGAYGVCNPDDSPVCSCLQGFKPKSPRNWDLREGKDGCARMTELDCRNGTDGFATIEKAKLPDTSRSTMDRSMRLDECGAMCLRNCSCTAYASANIDGTGCIIWTTELTDIRVFTFGGQDLYVRLAAADLALGSDHSHSHTIAGIVVGSIAGILLLAVAAICVRMKRRRRTAATLGGIPFASHRNNEYKDGKNWELPLFDLGTIIAATDNFSIKNKLGKGGFGPVYKGMLGEEQEIAVKRLSKTSAQGTDEFMNEVMLIAKLQHRNLVRLLGCCSQGEERMLVYEYMPNKSLDAFLFDKDKGVLLDWQTRYNIIEGIAQGLLYLHRDSRLRIIHRDLKASNILLDKDMNPKISDFGLARIFRGDETALNTRRVVGTYGYMSPEYAMDGVFSVKFDVFSFGVLVLEIISGKKNRGVSISEYEGNLLAHAWSLWMHGNGLELVDKSISHSISMVEALNCIKVGLLSVQESPKDRPTMSSVVLMLGSKDASLPDPKHPGFFPTKASSKTESSKSKTNSASINELSVTIVEGR
ncbi:G-type lectin S-receptor-like serine/threonine-protein kinase At4g27290 isoform X4 [Phoenix dactylifera]|uniref:Receptor-like serine/threonine-protein kinase n=1 Tax=Phoenix dactylifera TaxID=42345 RepID=A0A8B9AEW1_PHODC|nr:G-type lectin S-receptor-like serine/threonine-protein kinase At4g27290 isoform X4 [Phoenix dactylifera]